MKVVELLEQRRRNWSELERLCQEMQTTRKRKMGAESIARFATLYRATCADLALADAYQLPHNTIAYLHQLVGQAHNQLYRSRKFNFQAWAHDMVYVLPQQLFRDNSLRLAFAIFWGIFLASMGLAYASPQFAEAYIGKETMNAMEEMHSHSVEGRDSNASGASAGFYQWHNTTIGIRVFAFGLLFGIGGLFELVFNAGFLGAVFGHMANSPQRDNFFEFVTAHGPFELTAIVLSAAGGMRLGFSLIDTRGLTRAASFRRAARQSIGTVSAAIVLFFFAALIEGFVSPSAAPYWFKAMVAAFSSLLMMFYFVLLGFRPPAPARHDPLGITP